MRPQGSPRAPTRRLSNWRLWDSWSFPPTPLTWSTARSYSCICWNRDRFRYVEEAFRVLRPGGRCYVDNFTVDTETGWKIFMESYAYLIDRRPAHISMSSSREELRTYLVRAGFEDVKVHDLANGLIAATGRKPESAP